MIDAHIIEARLLTDDEFLLKCLLVLYNHQEYDEQDTHSTYHQNGCGFNTADAPILTVLAEKAQYGDLNSEQIKVCRKRITKYCKQLTQYLTEDEIL